MVSWDVVGTVAGVVVGAVLVWAGFLKLRDPRGWLRQAADMKVGRSVAIVVPWVELVVGTSLALGLFAPWSALAAGALLVVFTIFIALRIADGSRPPCACFGSRSNRPLGPWQLVRNFVLLGLVALTVAAA